jgi:hypothetical protein
MFILKAFAEHAQLVSNTLGVVNAIGELSTRSLTFAREKGQYRAAATDPIRLVTFTSANDATPTTLSTAQSNHVLTIVDGLYDYMFAHPGENFSDTIHDYMLATFAASAEDFVVGPIVNDGTNYICEWIQWSAKSVTGWTATTLKVWLSDAAFQAQYDDFQIVVVPPITNLNDFFKSPTQVQLAVDAETPITITNRVQTAKAGYPETVQRTELFDWIDPFDPEHTIATQWNVLIYGEAGNNPDSISDALVAYVLANSTHTKPQWTPLIPEIFRRTEFMIVPLWDQYAVANMIVQAGIYSPVANLKRAVALIKSVINDTVNYPLAHIDDHVQLMAHPYKSLQVLSVGNPTNRDSMVEITDVYPDVLSVSTSSLDFNRMQPETKAFLTAFADLLVAAEEMTIYSSVPAGMAKSIRQGKLYLVKRVDNIDYLVLAKGELTTVIPGV